MISRASSTGRSAQRGPTPVGPLGRSSAKAGGPAWFKQIPLLERGAPKSGRMVLTTRARAERWSSRKRLGRSVDDGSRDPRDERVRCRNPRSAGTPIGGVLGIFSSGGSCLGSCGSTADRVGTEINEAVPRPHCTNPWFRGTSTSRGRRLLARWSLNAPVNDRRGRARRYAQGSTFGHAHAMVLGSTFTRKRSGRPCPDGCGERGGRLPVASARVGGPPGTTPSRGSLRERVS